MKSNPTKINVRAAMRQLAPSEQIMLERYLYSPSSVRSTAAELKENSGKAYSVSVQTDCIVVTRIT